MQDIFSIFFLRKILSVPLSFLRNHRRTLREVIRNFAKLELSELRYKYIGICSETGDRSVYRRAAVSLAAQLSVSLRQSLSCRVFRFRHPHISSPSRHIPLLLGV